MIKQLLAEHFPSRYYFFINKGGENSASVNAKDYKMARMASESLIRMWMSKEGVDKLLIAQIFATSHIKQVNSLTDIILTTYKPVLNAENEIEWREEAPMQNVGVLVILAALWRNIILSIKYNIKRIYSFLEMLVELFLRLLSAPLCIIFTLLWCLWLMIFMPTELTNLFVEGRLREFIDKEMERAFFHARWISFVLLILFLCHRLIR